MKASATGCSTTSCLCQILSSWNRWCLTVMIRCPEMLRSVSRPTVVSIVAACRAISSVCWWAKDAKDALRSKPDRCWTARGMGRSTCNWEWRQARSQNSKSWYLTLPYISTCWELGWEGKLVSGTSLRLNQRWWQNHTKPPGCSTWVSQTLRRQKTDRNLWCPHDSVLGVWASEIDNVAQK